MHRGITDQLLHGVLDFGLVGVGADADVTRRQPRLDRLLLLHPDVHLARFVIPDQDGGQTDLGRAGGFDLRLEPGQQRVPQMVAVHQHRSPVGTGELFGVHGCWKVGCWTSGL